MTERNDFLLMPSIVPPLCRPVSGCAVVGYWTSLYSDKSERQVLVMWVCLVSVREMMSKSLCLRRKAMSSIVVCIPRVFRVRSVSPQGVALEAVAYWGSGFAALAIVVGVGGVMGVEGVSSSRVRLGAGFRKGRREDWCRMGLIGGVDRFVVGLERWASLGRCRFLGFLWAGALGMRGVGEGVCGIALPPALGLAGRGTVPGGVRFWRSGMKSASQGWSVPVINLRRWILCIWST